MVFFETSLLNLAFFSKQEPSGNVSALVSQEMSKPVTHREQTSDIPRS